MKSKPTIQELQKEIALLKEELSEDKYRGYFEQDISGVYRSSIEGMLIDCNKTFAGILGYTVSEIKKINLDELYPNAGIRKKFIKNKKDNRNLINQEIDLVKKDGQIIHCIENVFGIFDNNDKLIEFQGYIFDITQRKKGEIALIESEGRFKRLFENLGDAVYVSVVGGKDRGNILEANKAATEQTGYSKKELLEMNIINDLFISDSGTGSIKEWDNILKNGDNATFIEKKRKKDGSEFWTEVIVTPFKFKGQQASLSINHDITNRILAKEALEESEKKFRDLFEKSGDAFLILKNRIFIDCNNAALRMLQYDNKNEFINVHPSLLSPKFQPDGKESVIKAEEMMQQCIEHGTHRFEWNHTKKNGVVFPVEVLLTAISAEQGNEIIHTVWRDITERNKDKRAIINAKNEAEKNEKKLRDLYEKSGDAIFIIENGRFTDCNLATVKLFGYDTKEELTNLHPSDLSPEYQSDGELSLDKSIRMMDISIKMGTNRFDWDHKTKNGLVFPVEVLLTAILNDSEKTIIHAVCRDISERKKIQNELISAKEKAVESDRLKSAFLANMSHEIRTPMNGILGFASLLKLPDLNKEQLIKYVAIIEKSGHRMLNIINDLMDISKIESGQMEVNIDYCNVNEQIKYLHSFFNPEAEREELKLTYTLALCDDEATIKTDNEKLYAILANLIKNSIKYSNEGEINIGYTKENNDLIFHINDNGIGIPKERQKAIFDRFVQADIEDKKAMEGAGLGLAIAKAYVEMLGGKIWLVSDEGMGTKFFFNIPYDPVIIKTKDSILDNKVEVNKEPKSKKLKILIAEDEEFSRNYLKITLKNTTDRILYAKTGREAIEVCKNHSDLDLILMDIKMPIMGGITATKEIRKFNKKIVIIAQTAYALPGDKEIATEAGCNDYISKPIDKDDLIQKIEKHTK